jgi:hypothetical protein
MEDSAKKAAFLFWEKKRSPRYFEIPHTKIRFYLLIAPTLALLFISALTGLSYYLWQSRNITTPTISTALISEANKMAQDLQKENEDLKTLVATLQKKSEIVAPMPTPEVASTTPVPKENPNVTIHDFPLNYMKPISGQKNLSNEIPIDVQDAKAKFVNNRLVYQSNLLNRTQGEEKVSGYLFVFYKTAQSIHTHPENTFDQNGQISFNKGEPFTTSRFRPVEAIFNLTNSKVPGTLTLMIFTRTGDIIKKHTINYP